MTRSRRTVLLLLLGSTGLVAAAAAILVVTIPSFKLGLKERWHQWSCPEIPGIRTVRVVSADGTVLVRDPFANDTVPRPCGPNVLYGFDSLIVFPALNITVPTRGRYPLDGASAAIVRRVGDVSIDLLSVSVGCMLNCVDPSPDIRIIIRIDRAGRLLKWNGKRLIAGEHRPNDRERFNFEWILKDLAVGPDDRIAVFLIGNSGEEIWIDDLGITFRSRAPLRPVIPHA